MSIVNNPQARARPATRAATCWRTLRGSLIVPVLALLSMTTAASADSPASAIQILDVDVVQRDLAGVRNDCWDDAPMDATVSCAPPTPEIGDLTATIELAMAASSDVVIEYESMDLTATAGTDYVALDGSLTIKAGEREGSIDIDFIDDLVEEGNEEFVVALTGTEGINLKHTHIHVTILDEESIKVLIANASQTEGHPDGMLVDLSFTESVPWPFTIRARTTAGTAGTSDYQDWPKLSSSLIVGTPERPVISFRFRHPLINDSLDEPNETYTITAWGYDNLGRESNSATMTIIDDDDAPEASIADASGLEDSVGMLSFDVTLNTASAKEVTLGYATSDDTATAGSDYTQTNGTLTFSAGETTKTISVPVLEDGSPEEDETFTVTLSNAANATIGDGTGTGTIQDDDPVPASLSIEDAVALESREAMEFPVTLSGDREEGVTVTVDYATKNRTAEAGKDYTETTGTLTFAPDVTEQTIRVPLLDDVIDEGHDIFVVLLSNAMGATFGDSLAEGKILDDDIASTKITLIASPARISEDDGATDIDVTAMLDGAGRTSAIEVTVSVAGSGNAGAVDFAEVEDFTITIAALHNRGTDTFTLTPIDDDVDESDETLSVTGTSFMTVTGTEVELVDDDATSSSIALTAQPPRVSEGDGSTEVGVTATLDAGARTEETTVTVTVSGSGDADAVDFADVRDFTITIAEGDTSGTGSFTLTPEDDNVDETEETLTVGGNSDLPVTADTVALADNDQPSAGILLTASPGRIAEDGGARSVQVTATLDASARAVATTVSVSVAGSGQSDAVDYSASTTVFDITIAAGATAGTGTFTVTPEDDEVDERDEVLDVAGTSDLPVTPTLVRLLDDEVTSTEIVLSAVPTTVSEGAGATPIEVTATLDAGARTVPTTVTVEVTGSGDPDAVDFASVRDLKIMIAAGATSGRWTFTLTPDDDDVAESSETLTVDGSSDLPVTETTVTLTDDDVASDRIVLSASPARVSEEGGAVGVRVTASLNGAVRPAATTVTVSVAGSGNSRAVDFQAVADFEMTIAANAANGTGTFTLTPVDDGAAEADETLTVSGLSDLPVTPTTVTLADDDDASTQILLSAVPGRVSEGDGPTSVTVTATLDRALRQQATSVTVSVSGSGDAGAVDFSAVPDFSITIPANAASGEETFTLRPEDDATVESDETLTVSGTSVLPVTPTAMTLVDNDEVSTRILLFLTVDPPRGSEGDGEIRVTVTAAVDRGVRPDETRIAVSVEGSGNPDAVDFDPVPDFDIVIPANTPNGTATFAVVPEDDLIVEADETLTVSGVSDLPVTPATMELLDDDEASGGIVLSADPARVSEGDGPVAVTVTASLDRGLRLEATTVTVSVTGSGDPDAVDFDPVADFGITIEANAPSGTGTFTLTPVDDAEDEADETLALTGESDLPVTPASVVLADDDEMASRVLSIADAEAAESAGEVRFAVTLDGPSAAEVAVSYATADPVGSSDPVAEAGIDYESAAGTLTFAPGEVSQTIRVSVLDDELDEPDETFALVLSDLRGAALGRGSALGTIRDDDEPPALSIAGDTGREDVGELVFSVTLMARAPTEVTVNYATMDDTAIAGDDYGRVEGTLTFAPGETAKTIRVAVVDDALDEADEESFAVTLSGPSGATLAHALATGVIRDNDEPPALSVADAAGDEDVGALEFAVTLSAPSGIEVSASYATKDGTAAAGGDYAAATGTLMFAPGEVSRTIAVSVIDDSLDEPDETFTLVLADPRGATLGRGSALGTIRDDDEPPALSIAGDTGPEDVGELVFSVTLMARALTEVTVNYATMDDTAIAGDDYEPVEGTLTFAPGETAKTIRVAVVDDAVDEADEESFAVTLSGPSGATLAHALATGVIRDDDEPPALSVADAAGDEDVGALEFAVALSAPSGIEVSASYATADGTATAGGDYAAAKGTLTFAPGETAKTIRVEILDDALDEADEESFAMTLSGNSGASLAHSLATGVIRDDDEPPALSVADAAGDEDAGALDFEVTLSAPSGIEVSASYATKDGTATAGGDYEAATGTLVFAPGEVSRTIRVEILDDALHEADEETFALTLSALHNATAVDDSAIGTIRDNDLAPPIIAGDLPAALLCVGGAPYELDLAKYFAGEELRFSAVSSTPLVATATLAGSRLTVAPASEGESSVTVTATNDAGSVSASLGVRVVTDPAELEAVESVLASIGRAVLTGVTDSVRARFDPGSAIGEQSASTNIQRGRTQVVPGASAVLGNRWPGPAMHGTRSGGWDGSGFFEPQVSGDDWFETTNRTYRRGMVPFSFSLDSAPSGSTGPAWAVWGRADAHRFESGIDGSSHDGTLTAVHLGADARVGDWLAGVSVARSAAQADYRFERSVDACGGGGVGEGMVDVDLTSVHPYVGRQIGRGQVWATLGAGGGEVSVERCETGRRNETDLSMRLAALGGRHPFAGGERIEVSVVEEIGVLDLTTGDAVGPVGDRSVRVGQARLGLEAAGVAPAGCDCSLTTFVRAFARGDWGDGATGTGLELAAGVRFRNVPRRLGIDAGIRALAAHSAEDAKEHSANLTFSILPKADGTGWQASLAWRQGASDARLDTLGGISPWTAPSASLPGAERRWIAESRLGYGIRLRRGFATPFVELDAGHSRRGGARFGVRHEVGDRARGLVIEWGIEPSSLANGGSRILLEALGRF